MGFSGKIQAVWAGEESSGKCIAFLTCHSNPGPPLRGSWLVAFSLQFVIRVSLHFDLIRPIGMAPNKNQSSSYSDRGSGRQRTSRLAGISTVRTYSLSYPSLLRHTTVPVHIGRKRKRFSSNRQSKALSTRVVVRGAWRKAFHFNKIWPSCELNECKCI